MRTQLAALALACALASGCPDPVAVYSPEPMTVALAGAGGAQSLFAVGTINDATDMQFPLLVDTGSPITARSGQKGFERINLDVWSADATPLERVRFPQSVVFDAPLASVGFGASDPIGGIIGGDLLSQFVMRFNYPAHTMAFESRLLSCGCELATDCQAVFHYPEAGGQLRIVVGENQFTYAPTRVLLDACLEPLPDPIPTVACVDAAGAITPPYLPSGVDVKVEIATGFPGVMIGASAYDRLRGQGAAAALLTASSEELQLGELSGQTVTVARTQLGRNELSAMAFVSREAYFGPCSELARSRRQRRVPPGATIPATLPDDMGVNPLFAERACLVKRSTNSDLAFVAGCAHRAGDGSVCDDTSENSPTAAFIEFSTPLDVFVADDTAVPLASINADVLPASIALDERASSGAVELIIGTAALQYLGFAIDYPQTRVVARCLDDSACRTYPRYVAPDNGDCASDSLCTPQKSIPIASVDSDPSHLGGRCLAP